VAEAPLPPEDFAAAVWPGRRLGSASMIATSAIPQAIDKLHLLVFMLGLRCAFFR